MNKKRILPLLTTMTLSALKLGRQQENTLRSYTESVTRQLKSVLGGLYPLGMTCVRSKRKANINRK
jgi:hypothetical protein